MSDGVPSIAGYGGLREIGRGGFSVVYKARQFEFDRRVAIKVLNKRLVDEASVAAFEQECRSMGSLSNHPYIVTLYASTFTSDHHPCIVMDLFEHGHYLTSVRSDGPLVLQELLSLGIRMSGALEASHRQGIVHGDVKPQNIFRSEYGLPALGDFGIATIGSGWSGRVLSLSIDYGAPELIERGTEAVNPLSDQYSLGATLYTLATGQRPFRTSSDETPSQTLTRMLSEPPPRLPDRFPQPLVAALQNTMARDPRDRYPDLATFAASLSHIEHQLGLPPTDIVLGARDRDTGQSPKHPAIPAPTVGGRESATVVRPTTQPLATPDPEPEERSRRRWLIPSVIAAAIAVALVASLIDWHRPSVPEPPAGLTLSEGNRSLSVSWSAPSNSGGADITDYEVRFCDNGTGCDTEDEWIPHDHTGSGTATSIGELTNGNAYQVRVRAINSAGHSDWSQPAIATPVGPPGLPVELTLSEGNRSLSVSWSAPSNSGGADITDYEVRFCDNGTGCDTEDEWIPHDHTGSGTATSIGELTNGNAYQVRVRAINSAGHSDWSQPAIATPVGPPGLPVELTLSEGNRSLSVSWSAPSNSGGADITDYEVRFCDNGTGCDTEDEWIPHDHTGSGTATSIGELTNGNAYQVRVRATNSAGHSDWSQPAIATPVGPPGLPVELTLSEGNRSLSVSWSAPSNSGGADITDYEVRFCDNGTGCDTEDEWIPHDHTGSGTATSIGELTNGNAYQVRVRATNSAGHSDWSQPAIATPVGPPGLPVELTLSEGNRSLSVSWSAPSNSGGADITDYEVRFCDNGTGCDTEDEWIPHDHTGSGTATSIGELTNGNAYQVRVRATNSAGHSDWSQPAEGTLGRQIWNYTAISAGNLHSCAIRSDGSVICWGSGDAGQTGAPDGTYKAVSTGNQHSCAISTDDTLTCWGDDQDGQANPPIGTYIAVSAGNRHSCAISTDDTLDCWGWNEDGQADPRIGTYKAVAAGWQHSCAISTDDTLDCWGLSEDGQADRPNGTYKAVAAGWRHSCAIRTTGYIDCWGLSENGQADPPNGTFTSISAGWKHSCAISIDGSLKCWGLNHEGQTNTPESTYTHITAGWSHSCAIRTDGILTCWGWNEHGQTTQPEPIRSASGW